MEKGGRDNEYKLLSTYRGELMGFAMLWVMLFHAYPLKVPTLPLKLFKQVGFGGVDIFIMLSGLGLYTSYLHRGPEPLWPYFKRRFVRILPAYWLVVGLYSLWLRWKGRISFTVMAWNLSTLHYWFHIPGSFNWYVPAILLFYLLAPLWMRLFQRCRWKGLLTFLAFPLSYLLCKVAGAVGIGYIVDFLYRIPSFALGLLMAHYIAEGTPLSHSHRAVWTGGVVCAILAGVWMLMQKAYIPTCYLINACLIPLCLLLAKLCAWIPRKGFYKALSTLGGCSLEIYLLNVVITREFDTLSPWLDFDSRHLLYYLLVYTINIAGGIFLHRGMESLTHRLQTGKASA